MYVFIDMFVHIVPMNRERKNSATSSSTTTFDPSKFVSTEVAEKYTKLVSLNFNKERGFFKPNGILRREISMRGWTKLCKHPAPVVALVVREFYANLCGERDKTIFV